MNWREIQKLVKNRKDHKNSNLFFRSILTLTPKEYLLKEQRPRMLYLYQQSRDHKERHATKTINSRYKK
jgi:hypothetical protein